MSSSTSPTTVVRVGRPLPEPLRLAKTDWRVLRPSSKSLRTSNPIRAIVDPIVAGIRSGEERGDGKDPISLAVSGKKAECTSLSHRIWLLTRSRDSWVTLQQLETFHLVR